MESLAVNGKTTAQACGRGQRLAAPNKTARRRRGGAALELALVLPLVLTVILGATDFGRFAHTQIAVAGAARAGAGHGAMNRFSTTTRSTWEAQIREVVQQDLTGLAGFDASQLRTDISVLTDGSGRQRVRVQVRHPFRMIIGWSFLPASVEIVQIAALPMMR